ncbi:unnamed protein product [Allacma fusca]|uniref:WAP domain-containing protein n=1 Tax=Allacma fusca TaxID=39272 RepID=A0A8J2LQT1_9HEXA|nr:unnamed protein product [Allacma fusca]
MHEYIRTLLFCLREDTIWNQNTICSCVVTISGNLPRPFKANKLEPKIMCGPDTLLILQDCKICYCPKANRHAVCSRKSCDQRTKPTGSCPTAVLNMDIYELCQPGIPSDQNFRPCKQDTDCPGSQLCCFDYCKRTYCTNPQTNSAPQLGGPGHGK